MHLKRHTNKAIRRLEKRQLMPMYQFHCNNCDEDIETFFGFDEKHEIDCEDCKTPMEKVFFAVGVILRGTGWGGQ